MRTAEAECDRERARAAGPVVVQFRRSPTPQDGLFQLTESEQPPLDAAALAQSQSEPILAEAGR